MTLRGKFSSIKRLTPIRRFPLDRLDLLVALALAILPFSYYLGLGLDWGSEESASAQAAATPPMGLADGADAPSAGDLAAAGEAPNAAVKTEPEDAEWSELTARLQDEAIAYSGRVAIYLKDLKRNRVWEYQADHLFPSASLIKVPIMAAVFDRIQKGELTLQTKLTLRRRHRIGGSGSLKWYRDGSQFTVRQVLDKMIDESDNTATRMMIDAVGMGYLQRQFPRMGLLYTEIYPEGMSLKSSRVAYENYTTAHEMASILERIYRGELVDRGSSELMLDILTHQKSRARLAKALPLGWEIAHKTGLLRGACHDTAIIFTPQGDFVFAVLTGQNRSYGRAKDFITHLGRIAYKYYRGDAGLYAHAGLPPRLSRRNSSSVVD